jgi:uncharacterized tellurite resistance protein B-like protein
MLDTIRTFLTELTSSSEKRSFGEDDYRLAAAALLFHVIAVDGAVSAEEREALSALLQSRFELDAGDAATLVSAAETADKEAVDLYGFTSILKRRLDEDEREHLIELMWTLVFTDGKVHEFEDNLLWRVAELLGVSSQARIRLKQAVRGDAGS